MIGSTNSLHPNPFQITDPAIPSGDTYYFVTDSGIQYEARFGRKRHEFFERTLSFSVMSDEFDNEYAETNRGEIYRVIATVVEIVKRYHERNNYVKSYEFTGEFKESEQEEQEKEVSIRSVLYYRCAKRILDEDWDVRMEGNKVIIYQK